MKNRALGLDRFEKQKLFLDTLHKNRMGGKICKLVLLDGELAEVPYATKHPAKLVSPRLTGNTYVSVNTFKNGARREENLYNIEAMYIDLDGHGMKEGTLKKAIHNTMCVLKAAERNGNLCTGTMKTLTGGGIGLFFVLKRSIPAFGEFAKYTACFDAVYSMLCERIAQILKDSGLVTLSVDKSVRDHTRVCRVPGTYNFNADTWSDLAECYDVTYSLEELVSGCHLDFKFSDGTKKKISRSMDRKEKRIPLSAFSMRKKNLEMLQALRDDWTGCREILCFIYYNCLYMMGLPDKEELLASFNGNFSVPLPQRELDNITEHIGNRPNGAYRYSDRKIAEVLSLTQDETALCSLTGDSQREKLRRERIRTKIARNREVLQQLSQGLLYSDVANNTGISLRTIKRIVKEYGCGRYLGRTIHWQDIKWEEEYERKVPKKTHIKEVHVPQTGCKNFGGTCDRAVSHSSNPSGTTGTGHGKQLDFSSKKIMKQYGYGLEFVSLVRDNIPDISIQKALDTQMWVLKDLRTKKEQTQVLDILNFLAAHNTYAPDFNTCAQDILYLLYGLRRGLVRVKLHGLVTDWKKYGTRSTPYPEHYHAAHSIEQLLAQLEEDFAVAPPVYRKLAEELKTCYNRIRSYSMAKLYIGKNCAVKRETYHARMDLLEVSDIAKVLSHAKDAREHGKKTGISFYMREFWDTATARIKKNACPAYS